MLLAAWIALAPSLASAQTESVTYKASAARIEGGPILFTAGSLWGFGGTLGVHYAFGEQRLFFLGGRIALLGGAASGYGGFGGFADADIGVRSRITSGRMGAFALVTAGGVGGGFIASGALPNPSSPIALFHLALRLGPSFDIGAFALDVLVGPTMIATSFGAAAALETILDLGVRF